MVTDQRDERIKILSEEVRKLTDDLSKTRAELHRAMRVIADLSVQHSVDQVTHPINEASAE